MIKAIIYTAIGYWVSRQIYHRYDVAKRKTEKAKEKQRLESYLKTRGFNSNEIQEALLIIYKEDEQ